jgi:hypothetical protein
MDYLFFYLSTNAQVKMPEQCKTETTHLLTPNILASYKTLTVHNYD